MKIYEVNKRLGFWVSFGFIDLDRGNVWPREYRWPCTCIGTSPDGENVRLLPCADHMDLCELPEGWDVEGMRQAALARMTSASRFARGRTRTVREMRDADRLVMVKIFDQGKSNGRSRDKGGDSNRSQG